MTQESSSRFESGAASNPPKGKNPRVMITIEIVQELNGLQVTNICLKADPRREVSNEVACSIASARMNKLLKVVRTAKQSGAKVGYKMNALTSIKVYNGEELILDSSEATRICEDSGFGSDSYTFRGVTSDKNKHSNVTGAYSFVQEMTSVEA